MDAFAIIIYTWMYLCLKLTYFAFYIPIWAFVSWLCFWPLSIECSICVNLCFCVIMWVFPFPSGYFMDLYILVFCVCLSFTSCLHLLCFSQGFLPLGFTFMCLSLFFFFFVSCYVHLSCCFFSWFFYSFSLLSLAFACPLLFCSYP